MSEVGEQRGRLVTISWARTRSLGEGHQFCQGDTAIPASHPSCGHPPPPFVSPASAGHRERGTHSGWELLLSSPPFHLLFTTPIVPLLSPVPPWRESQWETGLTSRDSQPCHYYHQPCPTTCTWLVEGDLSQLATSDRGRHVVCAPWNSNTGAVHQLLAVSKN